jgi:surface polysaccharide O-acyltransferase-like enzyme
MKNRLGEFDCLRAAAVLAVIAIHATSRYVEINSAAYLLNQIVRFAVPLFIVLSGFLLYYSGMNRPQAAGFGFLKKRLDKVLIPYILWTLIYMLYGIRNSLGNALTSSFLSKLAANLLYGKAAPQLYFIIIILQMYLLYGILEKLINSRYEKQFMLAAFFITTYISLGGYLFRWNIYIMPRLSIGYYIIFPTWLFYFVFGMYFAKYGERFKPILISSRLKLGLLWLASLGMLYMDSRLSNTYGSSMKPATMLYCFTSLLFFYSVFSTRTFKETQLIRWVSEQSFFVYFCHVLLIEIILTHFRAAFFGAAWSSIFGVASLLIFDTLASFGLAYLLHFLPYSKYFGCTPKKPKQQQNMRATV